eukprot:TRINITY_DN23519_c0_g3_i1.p1 TRINITY_DN23519_c0_g3~~TRINITY_DN23519_c0_g3_i1.p1  ORF type:complete len:408 (+),score=78.75 TRINITY_DN23519_c0_g3_i1:82-1305(+)
MAATAGYVEVSPEKAAPGTQVDDSTHTSVMVKKRKVVVRVPATTANLGPGFDTIGMAVDIWNEIQVERADVFSIENFGEGVGKIPVEIDKDGKSDHLVVLALRRAFEYAGEMPMPPLRIVTRNRIPVCSGFGSSSSAIVGGLLAGLVLAGKELRVHNLEDVTNNQSVDPEELLHLATDIEGHPDNVAPAIYGGIQLSMVFQKDLDLGVPESVMSRRVPHPAGMRIVAYVPSEEARLSSGLDKTSEMRNLLKPTISRADAVVNIQRVALLVDSLHRGCLRSLRFATRDRLHQPIRGAVAYPHLEPMVNAALDAGAHGAFLSGAGPTVLALCSGQAGDIFTQRSTERQEGIVAEAMKEALKTLPEEKAAFWGQGTCYIVSPSTFGAHVVSAEPKFSGGLATFGSLDGEL